MSNSNASENIVQPTTKTKTLPNKLPSLEERMFGREFDMNNGQAANVGSTITVQVGKSEKFGKSVSISAFNS